MCDFLVSTVLAGDCSRDWDNLTEVIDGAVPGIDGNVTPYLDYNLFGK